MTDSFRKIDYRLRPAKHAERLMLAEVVRRMRFEHIDRYQYVGFGSVAFVDHRMMHRQLGIETMTSIEGSTKQAVKERFSHNVPLACISMRFGMSWDVLPTLDWSKRSIVWLDYDGQVDRRMATDVQTVGSKVPSGSLIVVSFCTRFPQEGKDRERHFDDLKKRFPEYIDEKFQPRSLDGDGLAKFARNAFSALLAKAVADADAGLPEEERRAVHQICFIRYSDGAPMCSLAWILCSRSEEGSLQASRFAELPFVRTEDDSFDIKVPLVTPFEARELERRIPDMGDPAIAWIPEPDRMNFLKLHRYLPHFGTFEPI